MNSRRKYFAGRKCSFYSSTTLHSYRPNCTVSKCAFTDYRHVTSFVSYSVEYQYLLNSTYNSDFTTPLGINLMSIIFSGDHSTLAYADQSNINIFGSILCSLIGVFYYVFRWQNVNKSVYIWTKIRRNLPFTRSTIVFVLNRVISGRLQSSQWRG